MAEAGAYILVGQTPVPAEPREWAKQFEDIANRRVAFTRVLDLVEVSTVFLGLDHAFFGGPPLLFESMAFWDGEGGYEMDRCSTWIQAEAQHARMVREVASVRALCAYAWRRWRDYWQHAVKDWRRCLK